MQLYTATLDNTSNNNMTCQETEDTHDCCGLPKWDSSEKQLLYVSLLSISLRILTPALVAWPM